MKRTKLNWEAVQKSRRKLLSKFSMIAATIAVYPISKMMGNNTFARTSKEWENGNGKHFFLIKNKDADGNIVDPWPCGTSIAISVEDDRYIFCKDSSMLYSFSNMPPNASKTNEQDFNKTEVEQDVYNRINSLNVINAKTGRGKKLGLSSLDTTKHYPEDTMEVLLDGEKQTAFNPENLLYEMLGTIQTLSKKNAELEFRLNQLEQEKGPQHTKTSTSYIKILENPVNSGNLEIECFIEERVKNASVSIVSMSGVKMQDFSIQQKGKNFKSFALDLPNGLYLCVLLTDGKVLSSQKFIVE